MNRLNQMLTTAKKQEKGQQWYKDQIDSLVNLTTGHDDFMEPESVRSREIQRNYDLMNNMIVKDDFEYVFNPKGSAQGWELPANFSNKDISSVKINAFISLEEEREFEWTAAAVNPEAVTEKQEEELNRIREWVYAELLAPMQMEAALEQDEAATGRPSTSTEMLDTQKQFAGSDQPNPEKISKYMRREYKHIAEAAAQQILNHGIKQQKLKYKFREALWYRAVAGMSVILVCPGQDHPRVKTINPKRFRYGRAEMSDLIHDANWQLMEYRWTPAEIVIEFAKDLTEDELKEIYDMHASDGMDSPNSWFANEDSDGDEYRIPVFHVVWRGLRKVGYLTFIDEEGIEQEIKVPDDYKLDKASGDISIDWTWEEQVEEGWRIGRDIYKKMGPMKNQDFFIMSNGKKRLPYIGSIDGGKGRKITSLVSRIREYQNLYNIIMYRVELMLASDRGKKVFMDLGIVPTKKGWSLDVFHHYLDAHGIGYVGAGGDDGALRSDIVNSIKEVDMSFISKIKDYIDLANYIEQRAGESIGVPRALEARTQAREAVKNVQQNMSAATSILEMHYALHDEVKQEVLQAYVDMAISMYHENGTTALTYVMDDQTIEFIKLPMDVLPMSRISVFVNNPDEATRAKEAIRIAAENALASQVIDFVDFLEVSTSNGMPAAREILQKAKEEREQQAQAAQAAEQEGAERLETIKAANEKQKHLYAIEQIKTKEVERRITELQKAAVVATGFLEDKDQNQNKIPDPIEYAKLFLERVKIDQENKRIEIEEKEANAKAAAAKNSSK